MLSTGRSRHIVVVQPYIPGYRTSFFTCLKARLEAVGCTLEVLHGPPPPSHTARQDASRLAHAFQVPVRRMAVPGGRSLVWQHVQRRVASADTVVLEQALHNLDTYALLLRQRLARRAGTAPRVAFWGHGRTYTKPVSRFEARAKDAMTRHGAWFFAYTEGGAAYLASRGYPRERITVVRNCVDTAELATVRDRADTPGTREFAEAATLRRRHQLLPGRTALFLGGLDGPKRIRFLLRSARNIAEGLPGFRLLVAGDGADRGLVNAAASSGRSPVVALGHTAGRHAALIGAVSDVMLMPGRVGLCAVDSFVLRTPIVTTDWSWHAPEFEYLDNGRNAVITRDDPAEFATAVRTLLDDRPRLDSLRAACRRDAADYTVDAMAARFCEGLLDMPG
ncbi:glycosyltransferase family 4 protein [Streptomyces sp. PSKA54]|uniref:Glycosyltransferase family 4 protein n=1 Tax=Streptomyces himalayensis subsp. aureolus TaxID=2758039 RepID=A0A7W2CXJ4_9ACTN|nr:glycosyltransferase family 4 protein [Streptomyces himalayensis]MBA4860960.1 glycosyltransferase family 4 protein [Streptomyces himalayensis subsp. aureolus]